MSRMRTVALCVLLLAASAGGGEEPPFYVEGQERLGLCWGSPDGPGGPSPERMERLSGVGDVLVATVPIPWGWVEPKPPVHNRPQYSWDGVDALVRGLDRAGATPVLVLTTGASWACVEPQDTDWARVVRKELPAAEAAAILRESRGATPPRDESWRLWERFVEDFVERYDGDGVVDMKGLRRPVRHVQILDRAQDPERWLGSAEEYLRLLHHADEAANRSSERCRLVHYAVDLRGTGADPVPDAEETARRRAKLLQPLPAAIALEWRRAFEFQDRTLEMPRLFRVVPHLGSGNLLDEAADVRALRRLLAERSAGAAEVWLQASPGRKLDAPAVKAERLPSSDELRTRQRWLSAALHPASADHARGLEWLRRGTAYDVVRTASLGRVAGAARVLVVGAAEDPAPEDWVARTERGGYERTPGWYAARQWVRLTTGHGEVEDVPVGSTARAARFLFPPSHPLPFVLVVLRDPNAGWAEDPDAADAAGARDTVSLPLPAGSYDVVPVALGDTEAPATTTESRGGILALSVGPAPVYVMPRRAAGGR
jgi:hypothetical protein